jgi:hypothetical protein
MNACACSVGNDLLGVGRNAAIKHTAFGDISHGGLAQYFGSRR